MTYLFDTLKSKSKNDDEISREIKIIGEELLKERKMGRPKKGQDSKPKVYKKTNF